MSWRVYLLHYTLTIIRQNMRFLLSAVLLLLPFSTFAHESTDRFKADIVANQDGSIKVFVLDTFNGDFWVFTGRDIPNTKPEKVKPKAKTEIEALRLKERHTQRLREAQLTPDVIEAVG